MATEEITISELELADEVLADMTIPVDTATETRATTLGAVKEWIDVDGAILNALPIGLVLPFGGGSAPQGFLKCDGSAISRTTYADLFAVIGTTYGTGDGSTTFNVPNYSNARFVTSGTISVKGDGKALGMTMGSSSEHITLYNSDSGTQRFAAMSNNSQNMGQPVGTTRVTGSTVPTTKLIGVTTDASKSGITGSVSLASACRFIIKY